MRALILLVSLFLASQALAQDNKSWPDGSAMGVGQKYIESRDYFIKQLNKKHEQLIKLVSSREYQFEHQRLVEAVASQHKAFLSYVVEECELIGALSGSGGSWPSTKAVGCEASLIEGRFKRVSSAIKCIEGLPVAKREFGQEACLYQLAQLNVGEWRR